MQSVSVQRLCKSYKSKFVLKNVNLDIKKGELVVLFGANGCGKTTLLNIIAGIIQEDRGIIKIEGKEPNKEKIGYVFQNYRDSLLPWRTNLENIAFPLELTGITKNRRCKKAKVLIKEFDLPLPLNNYPYQSSGGEQQLVALLREVIAEPSLILMDEPFSALHQSSKEYLRVKLQEIWKKLGLTVLFVSHDITEALQLADRVLVMSSNPGRIVKQFNVNFQRPRRSKLVYSKQFSSLRKKILLYMEKDVL